MIIMIIIIIIIIINIIIIIIILWRASNYAKFSASRYPSLYDPLLTSILTISRRRHVAAQGAQNRRADLFPIHS